MPRPFRRGTAGAWPVVMPEIEAWREPLIEAVIESGGSEAVRTSLTRLPCESCLRMLAASRFSSAVRTTESNRSAISWVEAKRFSGAFSSAL